jgi:hypothetical protein
MPSNSPQPLSIPQSGVTPDFLQQYISQYNTAMTPGGAAPGMNNYLNSPNYQAQFGANAQQLAQQQGTVSPVANPGNIGNTSFNDFVNSAAYKTAYGNNASEDPLSRFQNDAGTQLALQQGQKALANLYSGKGLGASGTYAKGLTDYMYNQYGNFIGGQKDLYNNVNNTNIGIQNQNIGNQMNTNQFNAGIRQNNINNYQGIQSLLGSNFNNYQNQLAGLSNAGNTASNALGSASNQNSQNLISILSQLYGNTGSALGQYGMSTGSDIASILANLGIYQGNAYINTGAAMANNMLSGSQLGVQLANAQNASNAQTQNSLLQGYGAVNSLYR